jgi:ubiquinone/menaquinone biosynthesis C-methylase UbiE
MSVNQFQTWEEAVHWLTSQPDKQEIVTACYYDMPPSAAANRYWQSNEWQSIQEHLPTAKGTALDIGAGNGISSFALAKDGWQVSALEPDPSEIVGVGAIRRLAQEHQLPIEVVCEFGEQLPFPDNHFDVVFARQVLHHAQDLPQLCREIARVLKPHGTFIAVRDHVIAKQADLPIFLANHPLHQLYGGENAYLLSEYLTAIKDAKLAVRQVLGSFDSPINYSPHTQATLKQELTNRISHFPAGNLIGKIMLHQAIFPAILKLMSKLDRRPGRAVSFICFKP